MPFVFQQAFHIMRSGRPGPVLIDLPFDVQMAEIEFDIDTYQPLPAYKPAATRAQIEKALTMLNEAERPLIVSGGGVINADASAQLVEFNAFAIRGQLVCLFGFVRIVFPAINHIAHRQLRSPFGRDRFLAVVCSRDLTIHSTGRVRVLAEVDDLQRAIAEGVG